MRHLAQVKSGEKVRINLIEGDNRFFGRITSIGMTVGGEVEVLQNEKKQPILIYSRDTLIALNRKECEKIFVEGEV